MVFNEKINKLLENFDIENYITKNFHALKSGKELRINCFAPDGCNGSDTKHHLWINPEKRRWICYKCGYGDPKSQPGTGSLLRFMADAENTTISQIIENLQNSYAPTPETILAENLEDKFNAVHNNATKPGLDWKPEFILLETLPAWPIALQNFLKYRGITETDIIANKGFIIRANYPGWQSRVCFPVFCNTQLISVAGRTYTNTHPKWLFWPNTDVHAGLWPQLNKFKRIAIVEGIFDAVAFSRLTRIPAYATLGKSLSNAQLNLLRTMAPAEIILAWDYDARKHMAMGASSNLNLKKAITRLQTVTPNVYIWQFYQDFWQTCDLGDLIKSDKDEEQSIQAMYRELQKIIHINSPDFLEWSIKVGLNL